MVNRIIKLAMVIAVVSVGVVVLGVIQQIQASKSMPTAVTIAQYDCGDGYAWVIKNENNVVLPGNWIETGEPTIARKRGKRPGNGIWWCGIDKDTRSSATH